MPSFSDLMKEGSARQENTEEYDEFVKKFQGSQYTKTSDDCYTPQNIYDAIADKVAERFGIDKSKFVRPFRPCGDYQAEKYPEDCVVVDNPPFSILSQIVDWYHEHGIRFFLFCSADSTFALANRDWIARYPVFSCITYENGAVVRTCFVSNLEESIAVDNWPDLYKAIKEEDNKNNNSKELITNDYDPHFITAPKLGRLAEYGIEFVIRHGQYQRISRVGDTNIYGSAICVSDKVAKAYKDAMNKADEVKLERERERERARVRVSPTEKEQAIIDELNKLD